MHGILALDHKIEDGSASSGFGPNLKCRAITSRIVHLHAKSELNYDWYGCGQAASGAQKHITFRKGSVIICSCSALACLEHTAHGGSHC